ELKARVIDRTNRPEATNHELGGFSSSVAHDLQVPLRGLNGLSRLLIEDHAANLSAEILGHLRRIRGASRRMGALIHDLLQLVGVARAELNMTEVDLSTLARTILQTLRATRDARVTVQDGIVAHGDRRLLRSALTRLLANAWRFTAPVAEPEISFGRSECDG